VVYVVDAGAVRQVAERHAVERQLAAGGRGLTAPAGLVMAGATASTSFRRFIAARPRWRMVRHQPMAQSATRGRAGSR
jgi:hypothetical protein